MNSYKINPVPRGDEVSITITFDDRSDVNAKIWDGSHSIKPTGKGLAVGSKNEQHVERIVYTISVLFFGNTPNRKV